LNAAKWTDTASSAVATSSVIFANYNAIITAFITER
jgi:hypothetical protein